MEKTKYMNPYIAGVLLGILLLVTIFITGRGLGASGAVKSGVVAAVSSIAPQHSADSKYYGDYLHEHENNPLKNWLVFEVIGVIIGAFVSGLVSNRLNFTLEKSKNVTSRVRIIAALLGGALFGLGAQLGRGCTSGSALSGMAVLSFGGIITMMAIFGGAYAFAYFFRKMWI
jgi:hypothetical protein